MTKVLFYIISINLPIYLLYKNFMIYENEQAYIIKRKKGLYIFVFLLSNIHTSGVLRVFAAF